MGWSLLVRVDSMGTLKLSCHSGGKYIQLRWWVLRSFPSGWGWFRSWHKCDVSLLMITFHFFWNPAPNSDKRFWAPKLFGKEMKQTNPGYFFVFFFGGGWTPPPQLLWGLPTPRCWGRFHSSAEGEAEMMTWIGWVWLSAFMDVLHIDVCPYCMDLWRFWMYVWT